jgi:tyrosinase
MVWCRKDQATLTSAEKTAFVNAVLKLKQNGKYNTYVDDHRNFMGVAHRGPAFFPWHREFLRRFELDLRAIDSSVTLPYWNWTIDNSATSSIWGIDFMGGNGRPSDGKVTTGPFAFDAGKWPLHVDGPFLRRGFGQSISNLPTPADLTNTLNAIPYDAPDYDRYSPSGFRNNAEGWISGPQMHNRVHVWIGGSMEPASSPNDPIFFLHHCFVDKIWADWQAQHPGIDFYLPSGIGPVGQRRDDSLEPWASRGEVITPVSRIDHHALGYAYDTEGLCAPIPPSFKFIDDPSKKFIDDPKLKFVDDPKLKFADDPPKFKFIDDGGTSPLADAVGPIDLGKLGASDDPRFTPNQGLRERVPFILSTPHHSNAWAQSAPSTQQANAEQMQALLAQYDQAIQEMNDAAMHRSLSQEEQGMAQRLVQEYQQLLAQFRQLMG